MCKRLQLLSATGACSKVSAQWDGALGVRVNTRRPEGKLLVLTCHALGADRVVAKILSALGQACQLGSLLFKSSASIGIALARKLKLDIVAAGVEHEAQRRFLIHGGCSSLQGFLLGRPLPIDDFENLYSAAWIGHA